MILLLVNYWRHSIWEGWLQILYQMIPASVESFTGQEDDAGEMVPDWYRRGYTGTTDI